MDVITAAGARIKVEDDTDDATIAALKKAPVHGGPRLGAGRPPATPGAAIAGALDGLERAVTAAEQRGNLHYEEARALHVRADTLTEKIEALLVATPDYPEEP